ncbi:MAG: carbohydrate binding family 9 domain-containing protein, partial [Calditrichaeota bacterium]|nr:carbohydrate binding family 9 domain-containing protein [Calditrichota bacterium]
MKHANLSVLVTRFLGFVFVGAVAAQMAAAAPAGNRSQERPVVRAVKVDQGPRIDGFLNDDCWKLADPAKGFLQREPQEGAPATEKTEVRIVYDGANLYFGIRCYDSEPEKIVATQLARDGDLDGDDHLSLVLDTYHDRRNAFYFSVNPLGARLDGYLTDESERFDMNWNGVWDC